jgi:hypothetical protein
MLLLGKIYGKRNNKKRENVTNVGKMKGKMEGKMEVKVTGNKRKSLK